MLKPFIEKLILRQNLSGSEMHQALDAILAAENPEQISAFLTLLRAKGETSGELYSLLEGMYATMLPIDVESSVLDIVGTGGDQSNSVNISTAASIVAAACGAKVIKHGNRSVSSQCGSADFIESLGVQLSMSEGQMKDCLDRTNIGFAFAPTFHPSMKKIASIRKALGIRTIFNFLGPLLNPARPQYRLIGVYSKDLMALFAEVLLRLPLRRAMIVHSCGLDELSLLGPSDVIEVEDGACRRYSITPESLGLQACTLSDIQGGDASANKRLLMSALSGEQGAIFDTIALNAGAALYVAEHVASIAEGVERAREAMISGKAVNTIDMWVAFSKSLGAAHA